MKLGLANFNTDYSISAAELGQLAEEHGFESLFLPEHTHIPVSRRTPYPAGGDLPEYYWHTLDPFVSLAHAAAHTERLLLATGICLIIERDPIVTAKEVASLDLLSDGRFLFGVGAGWNREEMENHGTDPKSRFSLMRERVEAMKAIWTEDEPEYHGKHVDFDPIWSWPKPVQKPHPPVLVGGNGDKVLDRVLAFGDEWIPNVGRDPEHVIPRVRELFERAEEAGREVKATASACPPKRDVLERVAEAGFHRAVMYVPPAGRDEVAPRVERYAELVPALADA